MWGSSFPGVIPIAFLSPLFNRNSSTCTSSLSNRVQSQRQWDLRAIGEIKDSKHVHHHHANKDYSTIRGGDIYIEHNFIEPSEIVALQNDIAQLKELHQFKPSGLSNRVPGDQNVFGESDRLTCTITPSLVKGDHQYSYMRSVVEEKLDILKHDLQLALSRNQHQDDNEHQSDGNMKLQFHLAEMYYSISPQGSRLPMHNDERHEDTKGDKGWVHDTRRSISWLIYLNDDGWGMHSGGDGDSLSTAGNGGELRAYCRKCNDDVQCGSNDGDIQVGWLRLPKSNEHLDNLYNPASNEVDDEKFEPIFLDSWVKSHVPDELEEQYGDMKWRPLSALYRMNHTNGSQNQTGLHSFSQRQYISKPFGADSPSWPSEVNLEPSDFAKALSDQLDEDFRSRFVGTEAIHEDVILIKDILPTGGTLVLFDSVAVPHEVLSVLDGERLAIAGWFHEVQQPFPEWYGT